MKLSSLSLVLAFFLVGAIPARAASPVVVTDIPTTHSLVSQVMGETGTPILLLHAGASPHDYTMRPSEASALAEADVVIWTSATLTPWLPKAMAALSPEPLSVELINNPATIKVPQRQSHDFTEDLHDHDETSVDPHAWLNPVNGQIWLQVIADTLSQLDPDNKAIYQTNAANAIKTLKQLDTNLGKQLTTLWGKPFIVFHDSFHYFEDRYRLPAITAISLSDASLPSIRQINDLRHILEANPGTCVFSEPQYSERVVDTITHKLDAKRSVIDPLGANLTPGAGLYEELLQNLANTLQQCLAG